MFGYFGYFWQLLSMLLQVAMDSSTCNGSLSINFKGDIHPTALLEDIVAAESVIEKHI